MIRPVRLRRPLYFDKLGSLTPVLLGGNAGAVITPVRMVGEDLMSVDVLRPVTFPGRLPHKKTRVFPFVR